MTDFFFCKDLFLHNICFAGAMSVNTQNTSKTLVEFRLYKPEGRNEGNTRCINSVVSPNQTSPNLRRSQHKGGDSYKMTKKDIKS